jgi:(p)ppGpp synthase/HD superfamily hydrolase
MNRVRFFTSIPAMPQDQRRLIQWAYFLAKKAHEGQTRDTGERHFEHLRAVAMVLIEHGYTEAEYIVLAVLHDSLEDTTVPLSMLEQLFGPRTAREIFSLSKVYGLEDPLTGFVEFSKKRARQDYFDGIRAGGQAPDDRQVRRSHPQPRGPRRAGGRDARVDPPAGGGL